jgi:hypothetical protein
LLLALQKGIMKLRKLLEGEEEEQFTAEQYMMLYTYATSTTLLLWPCFACHNAPQSHLMHASPVVQDDLQHVHTEATERLLRAAVHQISRLLQPVH